MAALAGAVSYTHLDVYKRQEPLAVSKGGMLDVDTAALAKQTAIGIGPRVDDVAALDPQQLVRLRTEDMVAAWQRDAVLDLSLIHISNIRAGIT